MFKKFEKLYFLYPYFLFGLIILLFYWPLRRAGFIVDDGGEIVSPEFEVRFPSEVK